MFRLLKKCESWKRKVLMQFLSVIDKKKGKKEAKIYKYKQITSIEYSKK